MTPIDQLLGAPTSFLDQLFSVLANDGIDVSNYELDHICYRVADHERYEDLKTNLAGIGHLLGENLIGGRPIASFRLREPIRYQEREIYVLELPAPKAGSPYPEGFEHVEFVIDQPLEDFVARFPALPFKTHGLAKAINADVQLSYDGFGVKFHRQSLEEVIRQEDAA
ncbi:VOC family protein [Flavilitoribacter nigricans]|nr:VOC family protein [Flavilitoribacter nigricans]